MTVLRAQIAGDRVRLPQGEIVLDQRRHQPHRVHREVVVLPVPAELSADVHLLVVEAELVGGPQRLHHVARGTASEDLQHGGSLVWFGPMASGPKDMAFPLRLHGAPRRCLADAHGFPPGSAPACGIVRAGRLAVLVEDTLRMRFGSIPPHGDCGLRGRSGGCPG